MSPDHSWATFREKGRDSFVIDSIGLGRKPLGDFALSDLLRSSPCLRDLRGEFFSVASPTMEMHTRLPRASESAFSGFGVRDILNQLGFPDPLRPLTGSPLTDLRLHDGCSVPG